MSPSNHVVDIRSSSSVQTVETPSTTTTTLQQAVARLGPVTCWLCQTLEDYRTIAGGNVPARTARNEPNVVVSDKIWTSSHCTPESELRILRTMSHVLDKLQSEVTCVTTTDAQSVEARGASKALSTILEYVRLPLLAILQLLEKSWYESDIDDPKDREFHRVIQSAQWNCVERASRVLERTLVMASATRQQQLEYLMACVTALPSSAVSHKRQTTTVGRLDTGDDCIASLLSTMQQIVTTHIDCYVEDVQIQSNWMRLLPVLLDKCIALIEPPHPVVSKDRHGVITSTATAPHSREPSLVVQHTAVTVIQCTLRVVVPTPDPWRQVFPGVYCGFYRRILGSIRLSHAQPLVQRVLIACVQGLVSLLSCSLPRGVRGDPTTRTTPSVLEQLQALSLSTQVATSSTANDTAKARDEPTPEDDFLVNIQDRVSSTLSVLVNMLTSSQSMQLRMQVVALNRVLLAETRHCWSDVFITTCTESVLVLCYDTALPVASAANQLFQEYAVLSSRDVQDVVVPRIMDVLERLELLVQSRSREIELQSTLRLLTGYVTLYSKHAVKLLRKSLSAEAVTLTIRQSLSAVLDVPLDIVDTLPSRGIIMSATSTFRNAPRLGPLSEETELNAKEMIHAFGRVLGPKQTTIFADACISDVFLSCVRKVERQESFEGRSHVMWLHERIGTIRLVQELMVGGFSVTDKDNMSSKAERNRVGYLISLGSSIVPIIISDPLWGLPTGACTMKVTTLVPGTTSIALPSKKKETTVSAALRGNATMICCLLELINTFIGLLGERIVRFTPIILYPLLEKAGQRNVNSVRDAALVCLHTLATSSGSMSVASLLSTHMESSLIGCMLAKIRVPGGQALSPETALERNLLTVVDSAVAVFRMVRDESFADDSEILSRDHGTMLVNMKELTVELTNRFDHASTVIADKEDIVILFLSLFRAALLLLRADQVRLSTGNCSVQSVATKEPWFDLLAPFEGGPPKPENPEEGFASFRAECVQCSEPDAIESYEKNNARLAADVDFVSHLAWRCGYLLSHASLCVQVESCDVLITCFAFLGWVASSASTSRQQTNGPATAVMRQVHASWQSIGARLKATCSSVLMPRNRCLIVISQQATASVPSNIGEQRVFLSKILHLVSAMIECSDDFMSSRFRESVWPRVRDILRGSWSEQQTSLESSDRTTDPISRHCHQTSRVESEVALLLSSIQCITRVFGHRPVGIVLSGLIPTIGAELWPFLNDEDERVTAACNDAIQKMIRIDSDALWRPIFEMTGKSFPVCPLTRFQGEGVASRMQSTPRATRVVEAANQLLRFIDALPEQIIE